MLDLEPIEARLAAATPFDFCWWPEEGQACGVRINGHTYIIPEGGRTFEWLQMVANAPTDLAALVWEVEMYQGEFDSLRSDRDYHMDRAERAEDQLAIVTQERDAEILRARTAEAEVVRLQGGAFGRLMNRHGEVLTERNRFHAALRDIAHGAYDGDRCAEIARQALATPAQGADDQEEGGLAEEAAKGVE